jgi:quercetin dioxygenase-like cupin family protein
MKIVHIDELPVNYRQSRGREGTTQSSIIMTGEDSNSPDNFSFRIIRAEGDRFSPRHHHNFAQYYYVLEGEPSFGPHAELKPGWLGYVPEGAWYGPLKGPPHTLIVLQHGGPSGLGMIGFDQHSEAFEALKKTGVFEKGIYRPNPGLEGSSSKGQDSYEAIWEQVRQRPIVYPEPEYLGSILINTGIFPWVPVDGQSAVQKRAFGSFTSCEYQAAAYKLDGGAQLIARGRGMFIVLSGGGSFGEASYRKLTCLYLECREQVTLVADEPSEILFLGLPEVASITGIGSQVASAPAPTDRHKVA